jgi:ribosomal-protein-alanine N-acetyltransferase
MIRNYSNKDKEEVVELLHRNTPEFFHSSEVDAFKKYLTNKVEDYFVVVEGSIIIGAGGINYFPKDNVARISWDVIDPKYQRKGFGRMLTEHRINYLKGNPNIISIIVRTTQLVYPFYEKIGFKLEKVEKNFWAEGFDLYQLKMNNINKK